MTTQGHQSHNSVSNFSTTSSTTTTTNPDTTNPGLSTSKTQSQPHIQPQSSSNGNGNGNEAVSKLAEALDDFLGDVERKFKGISEEVLARLDEMAERCDRLEGELLAKETGRAVSGQGREGESTPVGTA